ncbi:hypothetical protein [Rhodococcus tibetensis]|uniref:Uncharacterized protein n=1 Tax=Rhodococcus tibetensis TaxID=2965064 RepID=A0ABT1Q7X2_9NOCA|nr:hypothetical protein [Rhodococcus sp. FXJ9.536]MCQ4118344.1 hypothetical protein [Rhodococcus sp. FXJ9.536]
MNAVDRTFFDARLDEKIDTDSLSGTAAFNGVEIEIRGTRRSNTGDHCTATIREYSA